MAARLGDNRDGEAGLTEKQETVTRLLMQVAGGEGCAAGELLPLVYDELRALASAYFRGERASHTMQPTALVHEAYMRLVDQTSIKWNSRNQFFVVAAKAMRNILVDHARAKGRSKRGGDWQRVSLSGAARAEGGSDSGELSLEEILAIDEAMTRLAALDERKARLVELRFFAGLSGEDAARILGIARSTAADEWRMARAWLYRELKGCEP